MSPWPSIWHEGKSERVYFMTADELNAPHRVEAHSRRIQYNEL